MINHRDLALWMLLSSIVVGAGLVGHRAQAQPKPAPEPLYARDFEDDTGGWITMGQGGKISQAREGTKAGTGALQFDYDVDNGGFSILAAPMVPGALNTLQALTFDIKSDHDTPLIVGLNEQGGGRFVAPLSLVADKWQRVELTPADFQLQNGADDPKDGNRKLDLDKIDALAIVDFSQMFVQGDVNNPIAKLLNVASGPRVLWIDEVRFSGKPLPASPQVEMPPNAVSIDSFQRPQVSWLGIGNIALEVAKAELPANNALQAKYRQEPGRIAAMVKPLAPGTLVGKEQLGFQIASEKPAILIMQLEENSGGKYNFMTQVAGDVKPKMVEVDFNSFKPAEDSKDDNNQLDLDQVKQIFVLDAAGMVGIGKGDNTLWLGRISAR